MMILYIDFDTGIFVSFLFLNSMVSLMFIRSESAGILREYYKSVYQNESH